MKKDYQKPSMTTHSVELSQMVCGTVTTASTNVGLNYNGGGSGPARSRDNGDWDEE